ncbi:MAG: UDP-N-acetylmuramate--L-alanine ligase [bacterium]|nr:UDP-N-acetylmuramate--L-alanine ligase [bacterium]
MLEDIHHIFIIGIRGVAMANIARILTQMGKHVEGSDVDDSFITDSVLAECNIKPINSFEADSLPQEVDLVIYAASHGGKHNAQVIEAEQNDIPVIHQVEFLAMLLSRFNTSIGVAGCHGKTTTASLLSYTLAKLSRDVSYMIGVSEFNNQFGGHYGGNEYFVIEADEYGIDPPDNITPKFHLLRPDYSIITNIDHDHPDVYETLDDTKKAFKTYALQSLQSDIVLRQLVVCMDDPNIVELLPSLPKESYITYGTGSKADVQLSDIKSSKNGTTFTLSSSLFEITNTPIETSLFGEKNALNTTAVIAMLLHIGFELSEIKAALADFTGAKRRFELLGEKDGITVFDDYAHHPAEIIATIQAAKARFPKQRIIVLFQPHTFSRTAKLAHEFAEALSYADKAILLPIFASARESGEHQTISSEIIVKAMNAKSNDKAFSAINEDAALLELDKIKEPNDIIFTMGAGDVYRLAPHILA